jgi:cytochrome c553
MTETKPRHTLLLAVLVGAALTSTAAALAGGARSGSTARAPATAADEKLSEADRDFFESKVRPLLVRNCIGCHTDRPGRGPAGGLLLDSAAGWRAGGDSGPAIVPGDVEASRLVHAVRRSEPSLAMPPDAPLDARDVAVLEEWIARGAPDPRDGAPVVGIDLERGRAHWAFRPVLDPTPPALAEDAPLAWRGHPIDAFVFERLAAEGLAPAPQADRRTLARRLYLDLVGLPPSPERVEAFAADTRPDAYERLVEELLASPHHGERWGRHWLDVARYADSNGLDENTAMANAWRFRDYVVDAFNADKPYDRFVEEQIAGDLLPPSDDPDLERDRLVGTGFLVLGAKMLAEQDEEKLALDIVDEQLDVLGRTFMGLTIGCARCHDHKFDPVSAEDYYALAGIFRSTRTMESLATVARWFEREVGSVAEVEARRAFEERHEELTLELEEIQDEALGDELAAWRRDIGPLLGAARDARASAVVLEAEDFARGNVGADDDNFGSPLTRIVREVRTVSPLFAEYEIDVPADGTYLLEVRYAAAESRGLTLVVDGVTQPDEVASYLTGSWNPDGQTWEEGPELVLTAGHHVLRFERKGSWPHVDAIALWPVRDPDGDAKVAPFSRFDRRLVRALALAIGRDEHASWLAPWQHFAEHGELAELEEGELSPLVLDFLANVPAPRDLVELEARYAAMLESLARRVAEADDDERYDELPEADRELWELLFDEGGPFAFTDAEGGPPIAAERSSEAARLEAELAELEAAEPADLPVALAVEDAEIVDLPVHLRGDHLNLGPRPIPRGFPAVFAHLVDGHAIGSESSGRLELARWLTDPRHPLTARVMVNRVWQGHFGRGLVGSSSNFGLRGDEPTHPELLDFLAARFVEGGWSVKALHRLIVTSQTYQQASAVAPAAAQRGALVDPDARFLWRYPTRRLEAEAVRDSILAVSGRLDPTVGGSLMTSQNHAYVTNDQSQANESYGAPRRTLYLPIVRNAMYEFLSTFDYADPSMSIDRRPSTTIASQALWLMHSPFVTQSAAALAQRVTDDVGSEPGAQVERLWALVLARAPRTDERATALQFLEAHADLAALAQVLLASSEFLHVP